MIEMIENVEENQRLEIKNVLNFRRKLNNQGLMNISKEIDKILIDNNARKNNGVITVTHNIAVENGKQVIDIEMFIPLDKEITAPSGYRFLPSFLLNDAYKLRIEGNPQQMQEAIQKFAEYIRNKNLKPSTPLYVVTVKESTGPLDVDDMITDLYSGVESL